MNVEIRYHAQFFVVDLKSDDSYEVTLLTMYDKEEIDNVSDTYIKYLLETM